MVETRVATQEMKDSAVDYWLAKLPVKATQPDRNPVPSVYRTDQERNSLRHAAIANGMRAEILLKVAMYLCMTERWVSSLKSLTCSNARTQRIWIPLMRSVASSSAALGRPWRPRCTSPPTPKPKLLLTTVRYTRWTGLRRADV